MRLFGIYSRNIFLVSFFVISWVTVSSCANSKRVRIPDTKSFELKNREVYVKVKHELFSHSTKHILVKNDSVFFNNKYYHLTEIESINQKKFSPGKTAGLVLAVTAASSLVFVVYIFMAFLGSNLGRGNY
jgi:hypothetical protein